MTANTARIVVGVVGTVAVQRGRGTAMLRTVPVTLVLMLGPAVVRFWLSDRTTHAVSWIRLTSVEKCLQLTAVTMC